MRMLIGVVWCIFFMIGLSSSFPIGTPKEPVDFEKSVTAPGITVALFYEADGSYAEEVEQYFGTLAEAFEEQNYPKLRFFRIDVRKLRLLAQRAQVSKFPALTLFVTQLKLDERKAVTIHVEPKNFDPTDFYWFFLKKYKNEETTNENQTAEEREDQDDLVVAEFQDIQGLVESSKSFIQQFYLSEFDSAVKEQQKESLQKQALSYFSQRSFHNNFLSFNYLPSPPDSPNLLTFPNLRSLSNKNQNEEHNEGISSHTLGDLILSSQSNPNLLILVECHWGRDYGSDLAWFSNIHRKVKTFRINCYSEPELCTKLSAQFDGSLSAQEQPFHFVKIQNGKYIVKTEPELQLSKWFNSVETGKGEWKKIEVGVEENGKVKNGMTGLQRLEAPSLQTLLAKNQLSSEKAVIGFFSRAKLGASDSKDKTFYTIFAQLPNLLHNHLFYELNIDSPSAQKLSEELGILQAPKICLHENEKLYCFKEEEEEEEVSAEVVVQQLREFIEHAYQAAPSLQIKNSLSHSTEKEIL